MPPSTDVPRSRRTFRPNDIRPGDLRPGAPRLVADEGPREPAPPVVEPRRVVRAGAEQARRPMVLRYTTLPAPRRTGPGGPAPDLPRLVRRARRQLLSELAVGTAISTAAGVTAWRLGGRRDSAWLRAFGRQTLAWAAADAAVVGWGLARQSPPAADAAATRAEAGRMRMLTAASAVADVGCLAAAAAGARRWPARQADAAAVAVQASFLLWLDARHARRFHVLARRG